MKQKILVLTSTFPRWPGDTTPPFVYELCKRLGNTFNIHVIAPHFHDAQKLEIKEDMTIHRFQYWWPDTKQTLCYNGGIMSHIGENKWLYLQALSLIFFECLEAMKIVREQKIDKIHAHWLFPQGFIALVMKIFFGIPYMITVHGGDIYGLQNPLFRFIKRQVLLHAKTITVVSKNIKKMILKEINQPLSIQVIPMGVDPEIFHPRKRSLTLRKKLGGGKIILFVGRLVEKKGVEYLIQAIPQVKKTFRKVKLVIIGTGVLEEKLKNLASELNIDKNVLFLGALENLKLPAYYASADVFVGPSIIEKNQDTEGLGLTFVEAIMSGTPVIGTEVGGISDVIDKNTGLLVPQKNSMTITQAVKKIFTNYKVSSESIIKKFNWKNINHRYVLLLKKYENCIQSYKVRFRK